MSANETPRIALITGGNRGIGFETAKQLAARGFRTVIAARDETKAKQAAEEIVAAGGKATFLALDVTSSDSVRRAADRFKNIADHLDVPINNAGIYPDEGVNVSSISRDQMV